jgi:hypothetical protein
LRFRLTDIADIEYDVGRKFGSSGTSARGPAHSVRTGETPALEPDDIPTHAALRDRARFALMVFSFARISAALRNASTRTTQLSGRRREAIGLDEVERIRVSGIAYVP